MLQGSTARLDSDCDSYSLGGEVVSQQGSPSPLSTPHLAKRKQLNTSKLRPKSVVDTSAEDYSPGNKSLSIFLDMATTVSCLVCCKGPRNSIDIIVSNSAFCFKLTGIFEKSSEPTGWCIQPGSGSPGGHT